MKVFLFPEKEFFPIEYQGKIHLLSKERIINYLKQPHFKNYKDIEIYFECGSTYCLLSDRIVETKRIICPKCIEKIGTKEINILWSNNSDTPLFEVLFSIEDSNNFL